MQTHAGENETHGGQHGTAVSVVIPAYNEEAAIGGVLQRVLAAWADAGRGGCEVIVVDDGSEDRTAEIASACPSVVVIRHGMNRGYGAALKSGIRQARSDVVCVTDADGTYPAESIPLLAARLRETGCDMVVGARAADSAAIPLMRRPAKWALRRLASYVVSGPIPDLNSGLRVFRRRTCLRFFDLLPNGFSFTATITLAMLHSGFRVEFLPVDYRRRVGKSKIRPLRDTMNFVQLVLRIALYFAPLKIFVPLSGLLVALGVLWGGFSRFVLGRLADVSTLVVVMAAIQVAVIGMLAELINHRLPNTYRRKE